MISSFEPSDCWLPTILSILSSQAIFLSRLASRLSNLAFLFCLASILDWGSSFVKLKIVGIQFGASGSSDLLLAL